MTRIVAWNYSEALDRKTEPLLALAPDVAIVAECSAHIERVGPLERLAWVGSYAFKGLGVFARPELDGRVGPIFDFQWFVPVKFEAIDLGVLAVWAFNQRGTLGGSRYGRTHCALANHEGFLRAADLVIGDFNDNVRWDTRTRPSFATTTQLLEGLGYENLYYASTGEEPGHESIGTLYFHRHDDQPYLIDHAFHRTDGMGRVAALEVGRWEEWRAYSDHVPLIVDLAG